uniref:G_PROTEIN_RECEP_F2_4 domain-containing protein n=1 Tax=Globodera pallida TaxID=36090 RepID=A0A183CLD5_GLOPA
NLQYFAIWTYCASLSYMYQGFMIAIIYCFTNREVQSVLHNCYTRHRLSHSRTPHRSSRYAPMASPYTQIRNNSSSLGANGTAAVRMGGVNGGGDCLLPPPPPHSNGTSSRMSEVGADSGTESMIISNRRSLSGTGGHGTISRTTEPMPMTLSSEPGQKENDFIDQFASPQLARRAQIVRGRRQSNQ